MNKEDIVRIAREAGFNAHIAIEHFGSFGYISKDNPDSALETFNRLEHFAAIVASAEREACANLCKEMYLSGDMDTGLAEEAIRARGEA